MKREEIAAILQRHQRHLDEKAGGQRANFSAMDVSGHRFAGANLRTAVFKGARLVNCSFAGANLSLADLYGADLSGTDLGDANLYRADLRGARIRGASFRGADLRGAKLDAALGWDMDFAGADLRGATGLDEVQFALALASGAILDERIRPRAEDWLAENRWVQGSVDRRRELAQEVRADTLATGAEERHWARLDLAEMLLLREDFASVAGARRILLALPDVPEHEDPDRATAAAGVAHMLRLLSDVMVQEDPGPSGQAWCTWARGLDPALTVPYWTWDFWDARFQPQRYTSAQVALFTSIRWAAEFQGSFQELCLWFDAPPESRHFAGARVG